MNYLGHAFLSFGDEEILTGNMIGDYVKGKKALELIPEKIKQGVLLHRKIDAFTDQHPATLRAKIWFKQDYGLYSGAILDSLFDHFLANDPKYFLSEADLKTFSDNTYSKLESQQAHFPEPFLRFFPHMKEHDWLFNYRNLMGMKKSLEGLKRRALYLPEIDKAYKIFIAQYYQLAQCYYELMDDLYPYVREHMAL